MATNKRDVQLLIRAKDEASKAFEAAAQTLENLLSVNDRVGVSAGKAGDRIQELAGLALNLDKAYSKISGSADNAAAAFARQQSSIAESRSQLSALEGQLQATARAQDNIRVAIVSQTLGGGDTSGLVAQLKLAATESNRFETQITKLQGTLRQQEAALDGSRSALQQVGSVANAAEIAQEQLRRSIEQETKALQAQTVAAERNARVLATVNAATGVTRDRSGLEALNAQIAAEQALIDKLKAEQDAQTELLRIEQARKNAATLLPGATNTGKSARDSAAVFQEADIRNAREAEKAIAAAARAEEQMAVAAQELRAAVNPLGAIQDKLNRELAEADNLYRKGKISAQELAQAQVLLKTNSDRAAQALNGSGAPGSKATLFGLSPYAVQNLGYQVNDVVTQIASGTSVMQTLAQQGGQIIQIFPRAGAAIVAAFSNPVILGTVAAVGALVLGIKEAADQAARLRTFEGALAASADGASYQATALAKASDQLERYGIKAADAVKVVRTFTSEGLDPSRFEDFGKTAKDLADVLGISLPDAAEKLAGSLTGGYQAVKELDDDLNFLTATQREHIKSLFEQGKTQDAVNESLRILSDRYQVAADKQRGEWAEAARSLGNAWDGFLKTLANTQIIQNTARELDGLGRAATNLFNRLNGVQTLEDVNSQIDELRRKIAEIKSSPGANNLSPLDLRVGQLKAYEKQLDELQRQRTQLVDDEERSVAAQQTRQQNTQREIKATEDLAARTRELADADKEASGAQRVSAAEAAARREAERDLAQDTFKYASDAAKQAYIQQKVTEARAKTEREITREREAQARSAAQDAARQQREFAQGIADNGRQGIMATAQSFDGKSESGNKADLQRLFQAAGVNIDPEMTAWCAAFVNAVLATNGIKGTGSLAARSFLGFGQDATSNPQVGDIVILNRGSDPRQGHVGFFQGFDEQGNVKVLGGNQSDGVNTQTFDKNRVLGIRRAPSQGQIAQQENREATQLAERQRQYNEGLDRQLQTREQDVAQMRELVGLSGEALLAKKREQAIEDAVLKARQEAEKAGVDTNGADFKFREAQIRATTGAYYDLANARQKAEAPIQEAQRNVDALQSQRQALQQSIQFELDRGNTAGAEQLQVQLEGVNTQLTAAIQNVIGMWAAIANNPEALAAIGKTKAEVEALVLGLKNGIPATQNLSTQFLMTGRQINETFANGVAGAFDKFAQAVANGENATQALKDAFLQFASDFLRQIAQMIIKQAIFNAISGGEGGASPGGGGIGGTIASFITKLFHGGGVAGQGVRSRVVDPAVFNNAMRYHGGGVAGLKPGEVPAILEQGERIRTVAQEAALQRQLATGGAGGGAPGTSLKVVNVFDAGEALKAGISTKVGERTMLNWIRDNNRAVQQAINS